MFSMKYKVRRNDSAAATDLASGYPPPEGWVGTRFVTFPRPEGFRLVCREHNSIMENRKR